MVQPGVPEDDPWVSKVSDKKCLDLFLITLSYSQLDMSFNDSSFVFRPIHVINFSWPWEERCLDLEGFGKSPVDEVFGGSAVYESFLFGHSACRFETYWYIDRIPGR
jgi:hypothetical protein